MKRRLAAPLLCLCLLGGVILANASAGLVPPSAASLAAGVERLTAPEMEGRGSATPGNESAARQIAEWLAAAGLRPAGDGGTFFQSFVFSTALAIAPGSALERLDATPTSFVAGRDFTPHGGSREGEVTGRVVFAGYGVAAADAAYDDYAGLDVRGAVVLVLDGSPASLPRHRPSRPEKLLAAKQRGAVAVLIAGNDLPSPDATRGGVGIVSATVSPAVADALLSAAGKRTAALASTIEHARAPASFATSTSVRIRVALARQEQRTANVIGVLPGTDPSLAHDAVVVGAHFDHLGRVRGVVYPGADDNASGTAVVVGLARAFAEAGGTPRTLVFALFSGEEAGLLGSGHYVRHPPIPLEHTVAMVNFDMVGRMRADAVSIGGVDSGTDLRRIVTEAAAPEQLQLTVHGSLYGGSDHARFYGAGMPVLFFFTGTHEDYHRPTDTADKINAHGMERVARIGIRVVERLAGRGPRPVYAVLPPAAARGGGGAPGGAFLGIVADPGGDSLQLASVQPGSAAARAGVRAGDVILRFAGVSVSSLDDLRALLGARRPGDRVDVVFLRDGHEHNASTTLDARPERRR